MAKASPELLREWASGRWSGGEPPAVDGFCIDSRQVRRGDMFVAIRTGKRDGHDFVEAARQCGAACAMVENELPIAIPQLVVDDTVAALQRMGAGNRQRFTGRLVAITGSCGKTSTKDLLSLLLEAGGQSVLRTEGNLNNYLGLPLTLLRIDPDEHDFAVVETGINQRGEMRLLAQMATPDVAIVTNIAAAHLEGLGSLEGVAEEKAILTTEIAPGGAIFMPASCLHFEALQARLPQTQVVRDLEARADGVMEVGCPLINYKLQRDDDAWQMHIHAAGWNDTVKLPPLSRGMCSNAALAIVVARHLGVSSSQIFTQLRKWSPAAFRGEVRHLHGVAFYIDCYNANPVSVQDAVSAFRDRFPNRRKLYLLGCMNELGPESETLHYKLGLELRLREQEGACVIGAQAESLARGLREGGDSAARVCVAKDMNSMRERLDQFVADGGEAVLLKGSRSYRLEQLIPGHSEARREAQSGC